MKRLGPLAFILALALTPASPSSAVSTCTGTSRNSYHGSVELAFENAGLTTYMGSRRFAFQLVPLGGQRFCSNNGGPSKLDMTFVASGSVISRVALARRGDAVEPDFSKQ